jgi:hypothetical protein
MALNRKLKNLLSEERRIMKKLICILTVASLVILLSSSLVNASLNVDVNVAKPTILPLESQQIIATTNEGGIGILFVLQPADGTPWTDFLNSHPVIKALYNLLPSDIKTALQGKIVSYKIVDTITGQAGGTETYDFLSDFTGINGAPSTAQGGTYKVVFAFISISGCFWHIEKDFACTSWFVVPETPFGTAMAIASPMVALATVTLYRRRKRNP